MSIFPHYSHYECSDISSELDQFIARAKKGKINIDALNVCIAALWSYALLTMYQASTGKYEVTMPGSQATVLRTRRQLMMYVCGSLCGLVILTPI